MNDIIIFFGLAFVIVGGIWGLCRWAENDANIWDHKLTLLPQNIMIIIGVILIIGGL